MEIDYKLSKKQEELLETFSKQMGEKSWALRRFQGTGLKYWRIDWNTEDEWMGEDDYSEAKTLQDCIDLVLAHIEK
jgi:hypothetical protein